MERENQIREAAVKYAEMAMSGEKTKCLKWFERGAYWADQNQKNPWNDTSDKLPEAVHGVMSDMVIVWTSNLDLRAAVYNTRTQEWLSAGRIEGNVDFWMPIPTPPIKH